MEKIIFVRENEKSNKVLFPKCENYDYVAYDALQPESFFWRFLGEPYQSHLGYGNTPEEAVANWLYNMWGITHFMVTEILQNVSVYQYVDFRYNLYAPFTRLLERHTSKINSFEEAVCKETKEEEGIVVRCITVKVSIHI